MQGRKLRWFSLWGTAFTLVVLLSGCNTMEGMGEDVEAAGGAVEESAEDARRY